MHGLPFFDLSYVVTVTGGLAVEIEGSVMIEGDGVDIRRMDLREPVRIFAFNADSSMLQFLGDHEDDLVSEVEEERGGKAGLAVAVAFAIVEHLFRETHVFLGELDWQTLLIDHVLDICREKALTAPVIVDLCSGSGCIAITLQKQLPRAEVYAVELSPDALVYLRQNKELNSSPINIIEGDVLRAETVKALPKADIIVSNPPYLTTQDMAELEKEVTCEPASALFGGSDGLGFYRAISLLWRSNIRTGGFIAYEFGMGQHDQVKMILQRAGYGNFSFRQDGGGIIRTIVADKNGASSPGYTDTSNRK